MSIFTQFVINKNYKTIVSQTDLLSKFFVTHPLILRQKTKGSSILCILHTLSIGGVLGYLQDTLTHFLLVVTELDQIVQPNTWMMFKAMLSTIHTFKSISNLAYFPSPLIPMQISDEEISCSIYLFVFVLAAKLHRKGTHIVILIYILSMLGEYGHIYHKFTQNNTT